MDAMVQRTSDCGFSAPVITQEIASYMLDNQLAEQIASVRAGYRQKARAVGASIDRALGRFLANTRGGRAAFYYYLTFQAIETHTRSAFFEFLARTTGDDAVDGPPTARKPRVVYIPGEHCVSATGDMVEQGARQLRISYGFEPTERIEEAMPLMAQAVAYAESRR